MTWQQAESNIRAQQGVSGSIDPNFHADQVAEIGQSIGVPSGGEVSYSPLSSQMSISTTPTPVGTFLLNSDVGLTNMTVNYINAGTNRERAQLIPSGVGTGNKYKFDFVGYCSLGTSNDIVFELYKAGIPTGITLTITPNLSIPIVFTRLIDDVDEGEELEMYVYTVTGSGALTFSDMHFNAIKFGV